MLGGMGMGGGTVLIPALTVILGVEQHVAQATNLIAFLPMALFTLKIHKENGLLHLTCFPLDYPFCIHHK